MLLFLIAVFAVPVIVRSDGTAAGTVRITLEYSFALIGAILCISAAWLSASEITADVVDSRLHLIATKPVSRPMILAAKFCGVLVIHAFLLIFAAAVVYSLTFYRVASADFSPEDRLKLEKEIFTARLAYYPDNNDADIDKQADDFLKRRLDEAQASGEKLPQEWLSVRNKQGDFSRQEILKRIRMTLRANRDRIAPGAIHTWTYSGLPEKLDGPFRIRYRLFTSETQTQQEKTYGLWGWRYNYPLQNESGGKNQRVDTDILFFPKMKEGEQVAYRILEFEIAPKMKEGADVRESERSSPYFYMRAPLKMMKEPGQFEVKSIGIPEHTAEMTQNGKGVLLYQNLDPKQSQFIQASDGPVLLIPVSGFFSNYCRAVLGTFFQIMVFAVLGTGFSACFTLPMGILLTFFYVIICMATRFILDIYTLTAVKPHNFVEQYSFYASQAAEWMLVNLNDFNMASRLAAGEFISWAMLGRLFALDVLLRTGPFLLLGLIVYTKRELAKAMKE